MPKITLPDGTIKIIKDTTNVYEIAQLIGDGLAKAALAGRVNGVLLDTSIAIDYDAQVTIITSKHPDGLDIIRHSFAHLVGHAVKQLYPEAKMAIGPVIEDGFYYDISYKKPFTLEDINTIENRVQSLINSNYDIIIEHADKSEARKIFTEREETYKLEIINEIPEHEGIKIYKHQEYKDMCRGPHVPNTRHLRAFKLLKVSGAYWRGNSNNEMLQRIYGTAWANKKDLKEHLQKLEEAEKRDHRKIGKKLSLFHSQEEAAGMIFWHPKGWTIYTLLQDYIREILKLNGYEEIRTPEIVDKSLWQKSGHWGKFKEDMFTTSSENRVFAIKPMNCPCHVQVFNQGLKSYKDLPIRLAEFGSCHRNEPSGALHGLMRVRNFVQDDAHIFCLESQIQEEVCSFIDLVFEVYKAFGFENILIKLSTRPDKRVGSDEIWDKSEKALIDAMTSKGIEWETLPGEGAFYGPKIEFSLKDCLNRVWQCGTIQVDFSMPGRLEATYIDESSQRKTPVMLHRAILGSFERFIGILIEHYEGKFPIWLAPDQVVVMSITSRSNDYCLEVNKKLIDKGYRSTVDIRNEKIGYKIREHTIQKIPYLVIIGDKEMESNTISIRSRNGNEKNQVSLDKLILSLEKNINSKDKNN